MADEYVPETKPYELTARSYVNKGRHVMGEILDLTEEEAERLAKVIRPAKGKKAPAAPTPAPAVVPPPLTPGTPAQ
jgi:hypothetical protein